MSLKISALCERLRQAVTPGGDCPATLAKCFGMGAEWPALPMRLLEDVTGDGVNHEWVSVLILAGFLPVLGGGECSRMRWLEASAIITL